MFCRLKKEEQQYKLKSGLSYNYTTSVLMIVKILQVAEGKYQMYFCSSTSNDHHEQHKLNLCHSRRNH